MGITKHDRIAQEIARKKHTVYHPDKGVDVPTSTQVIEVDLDAGKLKEGVRFVEEEASDPRRKARIRICWLPKSLISPNRIYYQGQEYSFLCEQQATKSPNRRSVPHRL